MILKAAMTRTVFLPHYSPPLHACINLIEKGGSVIAFIGDAIRRPYQWIRKLPGYVRQQNGQPNLPFTPLCNGAVLYPVYRLLPVPRYGEEICFFDMVARNLLSTSSIRQDMTRRPFLISSPRIPGSRRGVRRTAGRRLATLCREDPFCAVRS